MFYKACFGSLLYDIRRVYLRDVHTKNDIYNNNYKYVVLKIIRTQVDGEVHTVANDIAGSRNTSMPCLHATWEATVDI